MGKFLTKLKVEKLSEADGLLGRANWVLLEDLVFISSVDNIKVIVRAGFVMDFASVPRLGFLYALAGDTGHASAAVHDYLCRTGYVPRKTADRIFLDALETEKVPLWRRHLMYIGVRIGSLYT